MSLGDLATNAVSGNPMGQMAQALAGPRPGAAVAPGGGGQQGAMNPAPTPAMAQPQATQSPPDLTQLYMRLYQQQRGAEMFDQGLSGLQAAFAPPGQQAAWLAHGSQGGRQDPGQMLQNLMQIQYMQRLNDARPAMVQALSGGGDGSGGGLTGGLPREVVNALPPDQLMKLLDQRAQSGIQIAQKTTEEANTNKLSATETFPTLDPQYKTAEDTVKWLQDHPDATTKAVHWGAAANGRVGQILGAGGILLDQDTRDARAKIDQLNDENFRAGLTNVKNVRSQSEANKVGGSVSSLDRPANSDEMIKAELSRLGNVVSGARVNLMAAAGKEIPYRYKDLVDPSYLNSGSPIYNGAKIEQPDTTIKSPGDVAKLASGRAFVIPDGSGQIGYAP